MIAACFMTLVFCGGDHSASPARVELAGIKCIVSGNTVSRECVCNYRDGKLYFDCNASKLAFLAAKRDFATRANHQLVVTKQYVQANCPISHRPVSGSSGEKMHFAGVLIRFDNEDCLQLLNAEVDPAKKIELVYGPRIFDQTFVRKK